MLIKVLSAEESDNYHFYQIEVENPYQAIEAIKNKEAPYRETGELFHHNTGEIMPIHNLTGIRDYSQIVRMSEKITGGEHIKETEYLPNIKIALCPDDKLLLFDGHHTMLAYYLSGYKDLGKIPHIIVSENKDKPLQIDKIAYFFQPENPKNAKKILGDNWFDFTVNWQSSNGLHIEKRRVQSIEQLANELSERNKSTS